MSGTQGTHSILMSSRSASGKRLKVIVNLLLGVLLVGGGINQSTLASGPPVLEVKPTVAQPDGILRLTFNTPISPASVKIGNVDASFVSSSNAVTVLDIRVPTNVPLGRQGIVVTPSGADSQPLTSSVVVAPLILGLKSNKNAEVEFSRVVIAGGEVILQFADKIPTEIRQALNVFLVNESTHSSHQICSYSIPEDNYLLIKLPKCSGVDAADQRSSDLDKNTTYSVRVEVGNEKTVLERQPRLRVEFSRSMYWRASLIVVGLIALIYLIYLIFYRTPEGRPRYTFLTMLLLEPENKTYSLSRAQFVLWLIAIVWSFLFLYYAHGFVQQIWSFPNLGNSIYAFLISLGTLVVAQATSRGLGAKGAGEEHPSPADLVVHGGVLALDRVQQVIWTLIAIGMYFRITVSTYATASALPDIPIELLALMGLSSAGYLGGKLVRGPGPIIEQVTPREEAHKVVLNIKGRHLSKDGFIWLDGVQQAKDQITTVADDSDEPLKFASELELSVETTLAEWRAAVHEISIVNSDAQRADFRIPAETGEGGAGGAGGGDSGAGEEPEITEVTAGQPDANGNVTLTIEGTGLSPGATITITGDTSFQAVQDSSNPNLFTAQVASDWTQEAHQLLLESNGKISSFTYPPSN